MTHRLAPAIFAVIVALWIAGPAQAAVDELAFGTSPQVMVYLFAVGEVCSMPKSPFTAKRVNSAVKFCRGTISEGMMEGLVEIQGLIRKKRFEQAKARAQHLQAMIYSE